MAFLLIRLHHLSSFPHSGYGMAGDLKCLLATWHQFLEEPLKMEGVLDLLSIHQKVTLSCCSHNFIQICFKNLAFGLKRNHKEHNVFFIKRVVTCAVCFDRLVIPYFSTFSKKQELLLES